MGSIDAGCNALLAFLHGDDCDPYFHAMHLLFTSGAAISPLILEAFLSVGQSFGYAWWAIGVVMITAAVLLPTYKSPKPAPIPAVTAPADDTPQPSSRSSEKPKSEDQVARRIVGSFLDDPNKNRWWCASVASMFLLVYYGCEVATGSLLASYVRLQGLATPSQANLITFSFWGAQSVGLAVCIFVSSRKVPPKLMLFGNLVFMTSGLGLFWGCRSSLFGSWCAAIVFGLGVSSGFPTMINLIQTYTEISGKVSSLISVASAVGEMTIPALIGSRMEDSRYSPSFLVLILGVGVAIQIIVYCVLVLTARPKLVRDDIEQASPEQRDQKELISHSNNDFSYNTRFVAW